MTARQDAGETLIELLITTVVVGLAGVAILGGVMTAIASSHFHRQQANALAGLRNRAESIGTASYQPCPAIFSVPSSSSGYTYVVKTVRYWNGTSFTGGCPADPNAPEKVSLQVKVTGGLYPDFTRTLDVVARKPCETAC